MMDEDGIDRRVREAVEPLLARRELRLQGDPVDAVRRRVAARARRRRAVIVSAAASVLVVLAAATVLAARGRPNDQDVKVVGPLSTEDRRPEAHDGVESLPAAPLEVRGDAAVVWTGEELLVWGGHVEAFNMGLPGGDRSYNDGAAYMPATGTWRAMSPSPLPSTAERAVGAATDAGVVLARGHSVALWQPGSNSWHELEEAPSAVTDLVSDGESVISHSTNAALDVATGRWRTLPPQPVELSRPTTAWTGREVIVVGASPSGAAAAIAYDLDRDEWRLLPAPPEDLTTEALSADWDGRRLVVVNYDMTAATYNPKAGTWEALPPIPARFYEWYPTLRSSGGLSAAFMGQALVVLTADDRWVPLPYGNIPIASLATTRPPASSAASPNGKLYIWSLDSSSGHNRLTAVDLEDLVANPGRVQVGVGSVALRTGQSLLDTRSGPAQTPTHAIEVELGPPGACTISSRYGTTLEEKTPETLRNGGRAIRWRRDETGQIWETAPTTSDVFRIECADPDTARALASSASFFPQ